MEAPVLRYSLRLLGPGAHGERISGGLLRAVLEVLTEGAKGAIRLRAEGRSTARGTVPHWLARGADFEVLGFRPGSAVIDLEAPTLLEVAPERFGQGDFLLEISPSDTALGLFHASLSDAAEGREDSDLIDDALLAKFEKLEDVLSWEITAIEFTNGGAGRPRVTIDADRLASVRRLRRETPPEQRVRLAGWLDAIRHSDRMFTLKLESGSTLRGIAEGIAPEVLAGLFGKKAFVSATAFFRPSGKVLRLEADHIEPAGDDFTFWSVEPRPLWGAPEPPLRQAQGPRSGINAIIAQWPGDESDEEIAAALKDLS
jgi:hypothetical protein